MYRFFESAIHPLLEATRLKTMVEVGSERGDHTSMLLAYVQERSAHLHVIDPDPLFHPEPFREMHSSYCTLHVEMSHHALPSINSPDVVLLDGDHNWYTVHEELRILDRICRKWPLTFLHDVEWPYGRRDMYYAPERVPTDHRQPYASWGIVRGRSALSRRGVNTGVMNAKHEGGPHNGVLTAVEDFLGETKRDLSLFIAPGNNGLAIVVDRRRLRKRDFANVLRAVHDPQAGAKLSPRYASTALA
jgi:hypothetical protein